MVEKKEEAKGAQQAEAEIKPAAGTRSIILLKLKLKHIHFRKNTLI